MSHPTASCAAGSAIASKARLDIVKLDKIVDFYFRRALATSTQRSYASAQSRYLAFCTQFLIAPLPVQELHLCRFASFLGNENISHSTIKCYLSAVRHLQIASNLPDPMITSMPKLESVIRGIKSQQALNKGSGDKRLPITPDHLLTLRRHFQQNSTTNDGIMLWAAVTSCFFGCMRAGEMTLSSESAFDPNTHLCFKDVSVDSIDNPKIVKLNIKASKTDPFRKGVEVVLGRTNNALCPVTALLAYLAVRGNGPGFLFLFSDGHPLTKQRFISRVRDALSANGVDSSKYAGHSFRIGAATAACAHGLNDSIIQMLGRWQSSAYQLYIRTPQYKLASFSAIIGDISPYTEI